MKWDKCLTQLDEISCTSARCRDCLDPNRQMPFSQRECVMDDARQRTNRHATQLGTPLSREATLDEAALLVGKRETDGVEATIIIPQHDRTDLTLSVVRALRHHETCSWPLVVVDDGSGAEAAAELERLPGDVRVVRQPHRGVTAAWNLGLEHVATPIVVLLNNDVRIDGAWVERLIRPVSERAATVSGVEVRQERAVPGNVLRHVGRSEFVAGWCWAFRKDDVEAVGGFDPTLWLYFSDTDLQARLLGRAGHDVRVAVVSDLPLRHVGHCSTRQLPGRSAQWRADRARFLAKWRGEG